MWICFGIPAIIGLVAAGPVGVLLFGLFFGYPAVLLTDFMKGSHVNVTGPIEKTDGKIDADNLIPFLYCTSKIFTVVYATFLSSFKKAKVFFPTGTRL